RLSWHESGHEAHAPTLDRFHGPDAGHCTGARPLGRTGRIAVHAPAAVVAGHPALRLDVPAVRALPARVRRAGARHGAVHPGLDRGHRVRKPAPDHDGSQPGSGGLGRAARGVRRKLARHRHHAGGAHGAAPAVRMNNRLRELREERGWSQGQLAELLGVSRQTVNALETGRYDPSLPLAFRIARLFGTAIEAVFLYEEES